MASVVAADNIVRLTYREKVPVSVMKEILQTCLQERLVGAQYEGEKCNESAKVLSDTIRSRLKNLGFQRYKFIVQVVIGERREQGIRMGTRCFWDSGSDNSASETYMNDHIFCSATAFAVYLY
mmetsp:Transcript_4229/g.4382  ORF Transcript_4229/g.4382 Transcript_4229/m.4382 type:complete len:123 (+) Transcript_4229:80-448(+)